ncbi:MAG TPA: XRE family transcriptional regulator [Candidatus Woesearchaeota archaeon]|nr:XRE family transcriptional regulator [Candidatus Woesearchaeota archaeon]
MFPCEKFAKNILPSLRAETVKELIQRGVQKSRIAEQLKITKSAVTQYSKGIRGGSSSKILKKYAKKIADRLEKGKDVRDLLCKACMESGKSQTNAEV